MRLLLESIWQLTFSSTPVIWVNRVGLYQCEVKCDELKVKGRMISVRLDLDRGNPVYIFVSSYSHVYFLAR